MPTQLKNKIYLSTTSFALLMLFAKPALACQNGFVAGLLASQQTERESVTISVHGSSRTVAQPDGPGIRSCFDKCMAERPNALPFQCVNFCLGKNPY